MKLWQRPLVPLEDLGICDRHARPGLAVLARNMASWNSASAYLMSSAYSCGDCVFAFCFGCTGDGFGTTTGLSTPPNGPPSS